MESAAVTAASAAQVYPDAISALARARPPVGLVRSGKGQGKTGGVEEGKELTEAALSCRVRGCTREWLLLASSRAHGTGLSPCCAGQQFGGAGRQELGGRGPVAAGSC